MNQQALENLYNERIKDLNTHIRITANYRQDLIQEGNIAVYQALKTDPNATDSFIERRIQWKMVDSLRRGKSVDNGFYKRKDLKIIPYQHFPEDGVIAETMCDKRLPVDEEAIFHISLSRFLKKLTGREKRFVRYKVIDELSTIEIVKRLRISLTTLREIRNEIRLKFTMVFAD